IELLKKQFTNDIRISIDTFYSGVAVKAVSAGAVLVNDISAGSIDSLMFEKISKLNVPYVLMHMQGTPKTMSQNPQYNNVTEDVMKFFIQKIDELKKLGVKDIIIDPG